MRVSVNQSEFATELTHAMGCVERRITIPALGNFLLTAKGRSLLITSTDLSMSFEASIDALVEEEGSICVPALKLTPYIQNCAKDEQLRLSVSDKQWVSIACGRNRTRIAGESVSAYPALPELDGESYIVPSDAIHSAIVRTINSCDDDPVKTFLNGIYFVVSHAGITATATNHKRLAHVQMAIDVAGVEEESSFILPSRSARQLMQLTGGKEPFNVDIVVGEKQVHFVMGNRTFSSRLQEGKYPNCKAVLARQLEHKALAPAGTVKDVLQRVGHFADDRSKAVLLQFNQDGLALLASTSDSGWAEESLDLNYDGPEVSIKLNAAFVLDFLKVAENNPIEILFTDKNSQTEWRVDGDPTYRFLLMPMVS